MRGGTNLGKSIAETPPVNATGKRGFTMKTEGGPSLPLKKVSPSEQKSALREKAAHQLSEFLVVTIYLCALFALLVVNQSVVLARESPD